MSNLSADNFITVHDFLEALNLPTKHPYVPDDDGSGESDCNVFDDPTKWSLSKYFLSWTDSSSESQLMHHSTSNEMYFSDFALPLWSSELKCNSIDAPTPKKVIADGPDSPVSVSYLEEISPCILAMLHMNLILWAPIVLMICLWRLTMRRMIYDERYPEDMDETSNQNAPSNRTPPKSSEIASSFDVLNHRPVTILARTKPRMSKTIQDTLSVFAFQNITKAESQGQDEAATISPTGGYFTFIVALIFSVILVTDAMYVLEFSRAALIVLHLLIISLGVKRLGAKVALYTALPISIVALYIMAHQDLNLPSFSPGLYYDENNSLVTSIVSKWPIDKRTYDDGRGTPWMMTGDTRTGLPFMLYKVPDIDFQRRWIPLPDEEEAIMLDIAFPSNNIIENNKRVYLVLHGINGDSHEGYVADFVDREVRHGNVVAVMVTRGLGGSPVLGENIVHFARTKDVEAAARALKSAIGRVSNNADILLSGVGYSMGAITLANYVASSGVRCDLDAAVAISGALDTREQIKFHRSASLWQPFIAKAIRDTLLSSFGDKILKRLSPQQLKESMTAASLVDFDRTFFVPYNDFDGLDDYYGRLGAMGDFISYDNKTSQGRIANVSIPLLCVHSLDDPIGYWAGYRDPDRVVRTGNGNTILLFTERGGHVGWPLGIIPSRDAWRWMSEVASSFSEAVDEARKVIL